MCSTISPASGEGLKNPITSSLLLPLTSMPGVFSRTTQDQCWNCRAVSNPNPLLVSTDAHFWLKIDVKFQSWCKISNISTSDPRFFYANSNTAQESLIRHFVVLWLAVHFVANIYMAEDHRLITSNKFHIVFVQPRSGFGTAKYSSSTFLCRTGIELDAFNTAVFVQACYFCDLCIELLTVWLM